MELNELREAAIVSLAAALDLPEEILAIPPVSTRQERDAEDRAEAERVIRDAADAMSDRIISSLGLDPTRYRLVYEIEGESR